MLRKPSSRNTTTWWKIISRRSPRKRRSQPMKNKIKTCLQMENLRAVAALIALRLDLPAHRATLRRAKSGASWTAVAERSGDTAFGRRTAVAAVSDFEWRQARRLSYESGVALRFPPQSMTRWVGGRLARGGAA